MRTWLLRWLLGQPDLVVCIRCGSVVMPAFHRNNNCSGDQRQNVIGQAGHLSDLNDRLKRLEEMLTSDHK